MDYLVIAILSAANHLVKDQNAVGLAVAFLVVLGASGLMHLLLKNILGRLELTSLGAAIHSWEKDTIPDFGAGLEKGGEGKMSTRSLVHLKELRASLIESKFNTDTTVSLVVPPSEILNIHTLNLGSAYARALPGILVSLGLMLTFLGLVSALSELNMNGNSDAMKASLSAMLAIASSKFTMSLTGISMSIVVTIANKLHEYSLKKKIDRICISIRMKAPFKTQEQISLEISEIATENHVALQETLTRTNDEFGEKLTASVAQVMTEKMTEIADAIKGQAQTNEALKSSVVETTTAATAEIVDAIKGHMEANETLSTSVIQATTEKLSEIVNAIKDQAPAVTQDVESGSGVLNVAIKKMTDSIDKSLKEVTESLDRVADKTRDVSVEIGEYATNAISDLGSTSQEAIEGLREQQRESQNVTNRFVEKMQESVRQIEQKVIAEAQNRHQEAERFNVVSLKLRDAIVDLNSIAKENKDLLSRHLQAQSHIAKTDSFEDLKSFIREASEGLSETKDAIQELAEGIAEGRQKNDPVDAGQSANAGVELALPDSFASGISAMANMSTSISEKIDRMSEVSLKNAEFLTDILRGLETSLRASSSAMEAKNTKLENLLKDMDKLNHKADKQINDLMEVDEILANSIDEFREKTTECVNDIGQSVQKMSGELSGTIEKMHKVVSNARNYEPERREL